MSSEDRDAQVWELLGGDPDELAVNSADVDENKEYVPMDTFREFQNEVLRRLDALENGERSGQEEQGPPIVHYSKIPEDEREKHLGTSDHIAVTLHDYWDDIAWSMGGARDQISGELTDRRIGVDTKTKANAKYNPSRLRHRLMQRLDRDFQANEIYRGMEALAKLSGGEEHVDEVASRVHITGGLYEYHQKATADGKDVKRVLWRVEE